MPPLCLVSGGRVYGSVGSGQAGSKSESCQCVEELCHTCLSAQARGSHLLSNPVKCQFYTDKLLQCLSELTLTLLFCLFINRFCCWLFALSWIWVSSSRRQWDSRARRIITLWFCGVPLLPSLWRKHGAHGGGQGTNIILLGCCSCLSFTYKLATCCSLVHLTHVHLMKNIAVLFFLAVV